MAQQTFLNIYGLLLSVLSMPRLEAFVPYSLPHHLHHHHHRQHRHCLYHDRPVTTAATTKIHFSSYKQIEHEEQQQEHHHHQQQHHHHQQQQQQQQDQQGQQDQQQQKQQLEQYDVVRSPLRFLGPGYPTIPLRFPHLATSSQRSRNITGVSLDFVLDTAANTNTINAQVAKELDLVKVGEAPGGVSAGGGMMGGDTFLLGECELDLSFASHHGANEEEDEAEAEEGGSNEDNEREEKRDHFIFMQELTASALPVASPAAAGLLSLAFFHCFEGGVEFHWGTPRENTGDIRYYNATAVIIPPSITFYGSSRHLDLDGMTRIPFESLPISMLPSVRLNINGVEIPALFDTGSPITVLNARAAKAVGIETCIPLKEMDPTLTKQSTSSGPSWNPFGSITKKMKSASKIAEATARGDILAIAGSDGRPVRLVKSQSPVEDDGLEDYGSSSVVLGAKNVYIGDLPGLAALGGLGGDSAPPAAVLGMDLLRCATRIVFRAQQNEIFL
ncbi:hypothetical protein ACHAXS_014435 [Conticribra weissflogii]